MNSIVPIGSVVKIKKSQKLIMIFGYLQTHPARPDKIFDYVGVPYPEGNLDLRAHVGFFDEDIEEVVFEGYKGEDFDAIADLMLQIKKAGVQEKL